MSSTSVSGPQQFRLGKYDVLKRLAAGGMAEIFLARPIGDSPVGGPDGPDGIVVVKRILPQLAVQPDFVAMFVDEAYLAAAMDHPNIVRTFDIGHEGESYFMVMEYLHGEDLRAMMRVRGHRRPLKVDHALHIISDVLAGLHYAHDKLGADGMPLEIVHRDVSPQNVLVTYDGAVKLLDFGIAKAQGRFGETKYGTLKGKIGYMSPEQCRGEPLDRRSDVFTATILLYELATGRRLYKGTSEFEVLKQIVEGEVPSPRSLDASFPAELDRIILTGLAKDPASRYQSAQEMGEELWAFALAEGLTVSGEALSRYMEELFGPKIEAWREARREGKDLVRHIIEQPEEPSLDDEEALNLPGSPAVGAEDVPHPIAHTPSARPRAAALAPTPPAMPRLPMPPPMPRLPTPRPMPTVPSGLLPATEAAVASRALSSPGMARYFVPLAIAAGAVFVGSAWGVVRLRHAARSERTRVPSAAGGGAEMAQRAAPAVLPGFLEVRTTPPGATLFLDGQQAARRTPTTLGGVAPSAPHVLVLELDGYRAEVRHITVRPGGLSRVAVPLEAWRGAASSPETQRLLPAPPDEPAR